MNSNADSRDSQFRQEMVKFGSLLHKNGFISGTDGNLSVRVASDRLLVTPTGTSKGLMSGDDMVLVDMNGHKLSGMRVPSSEIGIHLTIYKLRPDVHAVIHAHPYTATGFASAGLALIEPVCSELVLALGKVPLAPYATPGTPKLSEALLPFIGDHNAILMANHGVVTYGPDLISAYLYIEAVEHCAQITLVTKQIGHCEFLSRENVRELDEARSRYKAAVL